MSKFSKLTLTGVEALSLYAQARYADAQFEDYLRRRYKDPEREFFQRYRTEIENVNRKHPLGPSAVKATLSVSDERLVPLMKQMVEAELTFIEMAHFLNLEDHRTRNGRPWTGDLCSNLFLRMKEAGRLEPDWSDI